MMVLIRREEKYFERMDLFWFSTPVFMTKESTSALLSMLWERMKEMLVLQSEKVRHLANAYVSFYRPKGVTVE